MKSEMSREAGSRFAGKKLFILALAVVFIAASCNKNSQSNQVDQTPIPTTASAKVDAAVNLLNAGVESEDAIQMQSDTDLVNSDQSIINSYNGVSNASSF
jgi:hypothetical protein